MPVLPTSPRRAALALGAATLLAAVVAAQAATTPAGAAVHTAVTPLAVSIKVAPYVDMGEWPTPNLATMANSGNLKSFTLAFVTSAGCKASWFNAYDPRA